MRSLILGMCLIGIIWAYHVKEHDFKVVIDTIELGKIPTNKYKIDLNASMPYLQDLAKEIAPRVSAKQPIAGTEAIMNDYADKIFGNLENLMIEGGFDPLELPDQHSGFHYTLIILYHGELDLTNGWLQDISTLHRGGNVIVDYSSNTKYLKITVPIAFDDMQFSYDYSAKIMGLGPVGSISGKIKNIGVTVKLGFDTANLVASLDKFEITNSGHIEVYFHGNVLTDWLADVLINVTTALLKPVILLIVENVIRGGLDTAVDAINSVVDSILNPATVASSTNVASLIYN